MIVYTYSELTAYQLLNPGKNYSSTNQMTIKEAADRIILLAEKIKADRLDIAMQKGVCKDAE